jgi:hypothetical protein
MQMPGRRGRQLRPLGGRDFVTRQTTVPDYLRWRVGTLRHDGGDVFDEVSKVASC